MHTTHSNITPITIRPVSPLLSMEMSRPFHRIKQKILGYKSKSMLFVSDKDSSSLLLASVHGPRVADHNKTPLIICGDIRAKRLESDPIDRFDLKPEG